jgi:hypothetical protein
VGWAGVRLSAGSGMRGMIAGERTKQEQARIWLDGTSLG